MRGQIEHWKTQKTGILTFYEFFVFSRLVQSAVKKMISVKSSFREVRFNRRKVMSHQCNYSLLDILHCYFVVVVQCLFLQRCRASNSFPFPVKIKSATLSKYTMQRV